MSTRLHGSIFQKTPVIIFMTVGSYTSYLLTPWIKVLLEKLSGLQLVKKLPKFYGTRRFITTYTSARNLSLPWDRSIQSMPPSYFLKIILLLSSHLCLVLPSGLFSSGFHTKTLYTPHLYPIHATCPTHIIHDLITWIIFGEKYRWLSFLLCSCLHSLVTSSFLGPNIPSAPCSQIFSAYVPSSVWLIKFHTHTTQQAQVYLNLYTFDSKLEDKRFCTAW
jgi:hypothetical protein